MLPGSWQGSTFRPVSELTLQTLNGRDLAVRAFPDKHCTLDLSEVAGIDSIGIAALVNLYREAHKHGVTLAIHGAGDRIRRLLALYGLTFP